MTFYNRELRRRGKSRRGAVFGVFVCVSLFVSNFVSMITAKRIKFRYETFQILSIDPAMILG